MSIIEKMTKIINDGDLAGAEHLIHDDYQFPMHSSGKKLSKADVIKWVGMKDVHKEKDGNKEAVMTYYKFKDGKVVHQETGATKLPK